MRSRFFAIVALVITSAFLSAAASQQTAAQLYQSGIYAEEVAGDLQKAIGIFEQILKQFPADTETAARAQLHVGLCYEKLGLEKARDAYQKVIDNYPGHAEAVGVARDKLAALLQAKGQSPADRKAPGVRRLWTATGNSELQGSVSPDGKYLSVVESDTGDLAIVEIVTGKQRRLTSNTGREWKEYAFGSRWSPDSTTLAYTWVNTNNKGELRLVALDGSSPRILAGENTGDWNAPLDWSADGKYVLATVSKTQTSADMSVISIGDGSVRTLKTFDRISADGLFSPDGRHIAYSRPSGVGVRERDIFLLSVNDVREHPVIQHRADDYLLGWLPEGRGLLFASDRSGSIDAWSIRLDNGQPQGEPAFVWRNIGMVKPMGLTREGALYFKTAGSQEDIYTAVLDPKTGKVTGTPQQEPLPYQGHNTMPAWSPDGKSLAYIALRSSGSQYVVSLYSTETGKVREFPNEKTFFYPRWAADGRALYVFAPDRGLYRIDVQSGEVSLFVKPDARGSQNAVLVSPDGKWIVQGHDTDAGSTDQILRRDTTSGQETLIERVSFDNCTLALSRDNRRLAMLLRTEENLRVFKVMEFPDGTPKEVYRFKQGGRFIIDIAWSPDGKFIYFHHDPAGDGQWHLKRIPAEGGEAQELGVVTRRSRQLSVHPDGLRVTYSALTPNTEPAQAWVMEHFLPKEKR